MILVCYEMQRIFILYNMINLLVFSERHELLVLIKMTVEKKALTCAFGNLLKFG